VNIKPWLTLTTVTVGRVTEATDGKGAMSSTTVTTTLPRATIWQSGSSDSYLSDKVAQASTHVLVCESSARTWTSTDTVITYGGNAYNVVGRPDNVANMSQLVTVGLELIT